MSTKKEVMESAAAAMKANGKGVGSGAYACGLILQGKLSVAEIAEKAKTTVSSVYWYRNNMKSLSIKLPEMERAAPAAKKAVKKAAKKAVKKVAKKAKAKKAAAPKAAEAEAL